MADFGFVGAEYQAASPTQDAQQCINWYPETDPTKADLPTTQENETQRGVIALYPTPGLVTRCQLVIGEVRALHVLPGGILFLAVSKNIIYLVTAAYTATAVGTLLSSSGRVYISNNGVSAYITDGVNRYTYDWVGNSFATVSDGAFNGGGWCDEIDNFIIYNRPGTNQWGCTNVGDVISGSLNLGTLIGSSNNITSVFADHRQVLVFGERYSERHINAGTFPFPFAIVPGSSIQHGTTAPGSISRLGEGVAFLANDTRGQATVVTWGAAVTSPVRISTFAIENAIQSYPVTDDAIGYTYTQSGHEFYVLTFPTQDITWVYDLATQLWHRRSWREPNTGIYHRHRGNCAANFGDDILVGDFENGKIYALSQSTYTESVGDTPNALPCLRRCRHLTNDLKRQFFSDLQIQFQPGVGLVSGQGSDPECILRWSNDGGFTWGNDHILKIGQMGEYKRRAIRRRLGWARDRVYEIVVTDPVYRVVVSANLTASGGAS